MEWIHGKEAACRLIVGVKDDDGFHPADVEIISFI
jgi:hypothetical protein